MTNKGSLLVFLGNHAITKGQEYTAKIGGTRVMVRVEDVTDEGVASVKVTRSSMGTQWLFQKFQGKLNGNTLSIS